MSSDTEQDVIAPRSGEELDANRLEAYLRENLSEHLPDPNAAMAIRQFSGGHANLTYLISFGEKEFVLRRPPLGPVAPLAHDMAREYRVLKALHPVYPAAPRVFLLCEDHEILGATFFIMERRYGRVVRKTIPPEFGGGRDEKSNRALSEVMIKALAAFHKVDYREAGLGDLGKAKGFMKRQIRGWAQAWHRSKTEENRLAAPVIAWLKENTPEEGNDSLVHNDWRLDNIMVGTDDPGKLIAVFDWDMCTAGEPLADLGTLLTTWLEPGESLGEDLPDIMPSKAPGFLSRAEAVELYGRETGFDVSNINYYYAFGSFKMAIIAQQIFERFKKGRTTDERFRNFDRACRGMISQAARLAGIE